MMSRSILSILIVCMSLCASAQSAQSSLSAKFSQVQYHPECGGWYFLSQQKNGETLYGMADISGNVIVSEARKYKLHKGYIEFYLLDSQKKAAHDQWQAEMKQYEIDKINYEKVKAQYNAEVEAYNRKVEAAKTEATNRWNNERARVEKVTRAKVEAEQRARAQQNTGGGWLGAIGAVLGGVSDGLAISNAVNAVKFEPFFDQVKGERGLVVGPSAPYNPLPTKPKEPESGYYWQNYSLRQPSNYAFVDYAKISEGNGYADVKTPDGNWGLVDASMLEVIPCTNSGKVLQGWINNDYCKVKINNGFGILNTKNSFVIAPEYDDLAKFGSQGYIAKKRNNYGIISMNGKELLPFNFQNISDKEGYLFCQKDKYWGIYTKTCEEIFPCQFQNIKISKVNGNAYLLNQIKGQWGVIDFNSGKTILANNYNSVEPMQMGSNKDCFRVKKGDFIGLYAENGSVILPPTFTAVEKGNGCFIVMKDNFAGLYTDAGAEMIAANRYNTFALDSVKVMNGSMPIFKTVNNNKVGICNFYGVELIPCQYASLEWSAPLKAFIAKDLSNKYGVVSIAGDEIIPCRLPGAPTYASENYLEYSDYSQKKYHSYVDFSGNTFYSWKNYKDRYKGDKEFEKADKKQQMALSRLAKEKKEILDNALSKVATATSKEAARRNTFSYYAQNYVERIINDWQQRGEFEKIDDWKLRVNEKSRSQKIYELTSEAQKSYIALHQPTLPPDRLSIVGSYDPDNETYRIKSLYAENDILVHVPTVDAQEFKANFSTLKKQPSFFIENDRLSLSEYQFTLPDGKKYSYSNQASLTYNIANVEYNFNPVELSGDYANKNFKGGKQTFTTTSLNFGTSDIDVGIPQTQTSNDKTFAVIIANENYQQEDGVDFAYNDGQIFRQYCTKTLGLPEKNVHFRSDATLNDMRFEFNWMKQIAAAYEGEAKFIVYYAGHGMPDTKTKNAYLLPVDGYSTDLTSGYRLSDIYEMLGELPSQNVVAFLDACFSGSQRDGHAITKGERGVAITPNIHTPKGNLVVFSATSGNETAHAFNEKQHGMFTYFLLKKFKEHEGPLELGDLVNYVKKEVKTTALREKNVSQTPTVDSASNLSTRWQKIQIK